MSKHTPEPWYMGPGSSHGDCDYEIYDGLVRSIAHVSCRHDDAPLAPGERSREAQANARLFLASPKLLAALESLIERTAWVCECGYGEEVEQAYTDARTAVAMARGEA